jgi:hypothetical protein
MKGGSNKVSYLFYPELGNLRATEWAGWAESLYVMRLL